MFRNVQKRFISFFTSPSVEIEHLILDADDISGGSAAVSFSNSPLSPKQWNSLPARRRISESSNPPFSESECLDVIERLFAVNSSLGAHLQRRQRHDTDDVGYSCDRMRNSRTDSLEYECMTPTAGAGLTHGGYSSCGEDDDDDDDYDEDVEIRARGGRSRLVMSSLGCVGGGGSSLEQESSSCSDSLMSQRTFSSLTHVSCSLFIPATPHRSFILFTAPSTISLQV